MVWDQATQTPLNDITRPPSLSLYLDAMAGRGNKRNRAAAQARGKRKTIETRMLTTKGEAGGKKGYPRLGKEEKGRGEVE